jgi:hypothetical protein
MFGITRTPIDFASGGGSAPAPFDPDYLRPDGVHTYLRPDGTSQYERPE